MPDSAQPSVSFGQEPNLTPSVPPPTDSPEKEKPSASRNRLALGISLVMISMILAAAWIMKKANNSEPSAPQESTAPLKKLIIQLSWFHTAEFAGFYIAQDTGFYKEAGLDIELLEAKPPEPVQDVIISGRADFGVTGIDGILLAKESGHPMKALAAIYQQSPVTFIMLKESGIEKPEDFAGKRVTIECGSNAEYPQRALLKKLQLTDKIKENCYTYSIDQLLNNDTDVFAGFVTNEPILLEQLGHPVKNILVVDYGINYYPNLIFTSEERVTTDRTTVQKFVTATLKGYEYALAHPEEAVTSTLKRKSGLGTLSIEHQRQTMSVQSPLIFIGKTPLGWMEKATWDQGLEILREQAIVQGGYDIASVFTNEFVKPE